MLDGFQAGLSWSIILRKRDAFRKAFENFDPKAVARFGEADVARLLENPGIVRSRAKSKRPSAGKGLSQDAGRRRRFLEIHLDHGRRKSHPKHRPSKTPLSEKISKELKKRGFSLSAR